MGPRRRGEHGTRPKASASLFWPHPVRQLDTAGAVWHQPDRAEQPLAAWDPAVGGQFSLGILRGQRLLGAVGLMPDSPGSIELAYWVRPEERGRGLASRAVLAATEWAHCELGVSRIWLEIEPGNEPSLRLAQRAGYRFEQRIPQHCRDWACDDAERDSWHDCLIWVHASGRAPTAAS